MILDKNQLIVHYQNLAGNPAWTDLIEKRREVINSYKERFFNDETMEENARERLRLKIIHQTDFIKSIIAQVKLMSVKEQK